MTDQNIIDLLKHKARGKSRLPFNPNEPTEREQLFANVAEMLEKEIAADQLIIKPEDHRLEEVTTLLLKLHDALIEGDETGNTCQWIAELLRECASKRIDAVEDDAFKNVDKIRAAMESVCNVVTEIDNSHLVSQLRAHRPNSLPNIVKD